MRYGKLQNVSPVLQSESEADTLERHFRSTSHSQRGVLSAILSRERNIWWLASAQEFPPFKKKRAGRSSSQREDNKNSRGNSNVVDLNRKLSTWGTKGSASISTDCAVRSFFPSNKNISRNCIIDGLKKDTLRTQRARKQITEVKIIQWSSDVLNSGAET